MAASDAVDFALSYAGEDAQVAKEIATPLQKLGFEVFFARERNHLLVGLDGESVFEKLFSTAKQVIVLVSASYKRKDWTRYEWDVIRERDPVNRFIPVRLDDTKLLGLPSNIMYTSLAEIDYEQLVRMCVMRLLAYEEQANIHRETDYERILRAIREDSGGALAKAYQLVADERTRNPLGDIELPECDCSASYEVAKLEWSDFSRLRRLTIRAIVPLNLSQEELQFNLEHCAATVFNEYKPDAVSVLGYKDDPFGFAVDGHFTAARVILAPQGKWENAQDGFAYNLPVEQFRFSITFEPTYYATPKPTEQRDRETFWRLVERQSAIEPDSKNFGQENQVAKIEIASEYGISVDELNRIIRRGAEQHWPMPPTD